MTNDEKHDLLIGKFLGKIVPGKGNVAYFSPNCCFDKEHPDKNLLPITNGENDVTCTCCGTVYRVTVVRSLTDYRQIFREILEDNRKLPELPKEITLK